MVYQHPWYVSLALHISNGWLGGLFISPKEKLAVGVKPSFLLLTGRCCRPDRMRLVVPTVERACGSNALPSLVIIDRTCPVAFAPL
jgi:hypothetical protein